MVWSDLTIWAVRDNEQQNRIIVYYRPRWNKSKSKNTAFPCLSGPNLTSSANVWLLFCAEHDGVLSHPIKEVLSPTFLQGQAACKLSLRPEQ